MALATIGRMLGRAAGIAALACLLMAVDSGRAGAQDSDLPSAREIRGFVERCRSTESAAEFNSSVDACFKALYGGDECAAKDLFQALSMQPGATHEDALEEIGDLIADGLGRGLQVRVSGDLINIAARRSNAAEAVQLLRLTDDPLILHRLCRQLLDGSLPRDTSPLELDKVDRPRHFIVGTVLLLCDVQYPSREESHLLLQATLMHEDEPLRRMALRATATVMLEGYWNDVRCPSATIHAFVHALTLVPVDGKEWYWAGNVGHRLRSVASVLVPSYDEILDRELKDRSVAEWLNEDRDRDQLLSMYWLLGPDAFRISDRLTAPDAGVDPDDWPSQVSIVASGNERDRRDEVKPLLGNVPENGIAAVIEWIEDDAERARVFRRWLQDGNTKWRGGLTDACEALGRRPANTTDDALLQEALHHRSGYVRGAAALGIARRHPEDASPSETVSRLLASSREGDWIAATLALSGGVRLAGKDVPRALALVGERKYRRVTGHWRPEILAAAIENCVSEAGTASLLTERLRTGNDEPNVRAHILRAIRTIGVPEGLSVAPMVECLKSTNPVERFEAAMAIEATGVSTVLDAAALEALLLDEVPEIRACGLRMWSKLVQIENVVPARPR
jgi:HEAT repeats